MLCMLEFIAMSDLGFNFALNTSDIFYHLLIVKEI